jgi:hypothetical protein
VPKFDFSEYKHDDYERQRMVYANSEGIEFNFFHNKVEVNSDNKELNLYVDYNLEECFFWDEEDSDEDDNRIVYLDEDGESIPESFKTFQMELYYSEPEIEGNIQYSNNKLAARKIKIPLGEGIIDFCYVDILQYKEDFSLYLALCSGEIFGEKKEKTHRIENADEYFKYQQWLYNRMFSPLTDFFHSSLYTAAFPPLIKNETATVINRYIRYIRSLQKEFLTLIEFCFDIDFYPDVMQGLIASERFGIYNSINDSLPNNFKRAERFRVSIGKMSGAKMPFGMSLEEMKKRLTSNPVRTKQFDDFEKKYNLEKGELNTLVKLPRFIVIEYTVSTIYDMMYLEFTKMLEHEIRMKKCKRCNKYFVMKGNYQTEYCDRADESSGYSCQTLGAQENYKSKLKDNEAWALYNKYYKRYFARSKVGTIKEAAFRKWQYEATLKRDLCQSGEYDVTEYAVWLHESFPNRQKK